MIHEVQIWILGIETIYAKEFINKIKIMLSQNIKQISSGYIQYTAYDTAP